MDRDGAWLTPREAGSLLGVSEQSILHGIDDGRFKSERVPTPHGPVWLVWVVAGWTTDDWDAALSQAGDAAGPVALAPSDSPVQAETVAPAAKHQRTGTGRYERTFEHQIKHGAILLHIPVEEYRAHIEAGERWCSGCKRWHPAADMVRSFGNRHGLGNNCRAAAREQYHQQTARKADAVS